MEDDEIRLQVLRRLHDDDELARFLGDLCRTSAAEEAAPAGLAIALKIADLFVQRNEISRVAFSADALLAADAEKLSWLKRHMRSVAVLDERAQCRGGEYLRLAIIIWLKSLMAPFVYGEEGHIKKLCYLFAGIGAMALDAARIVIARH